MSSQLRTNISLAFIALLSFYLWEKTVFIKTESQMHWLFYVHSIVILVSYVSLKFTFLPNKFHPFVRGLIAVSVFFLVFIIWNYTFRWYSDNHEYRGNIFRGILYGFRAPFYSRLKLKIELSDYYPLFFSGFAFILLVFTVKWNENKRWVSPLLLLLGALLFFSFAWDTSIHKTLLATNCHYKTFSEGLVNFSSWSTFLSTYSDQMKSLGAHNNHYPPGVILLLKLNKEYFPYLFKTIVLAAPLVSLFPIKGILKHFSISNQSINVYIAFYISSFALLFFPGKSITPLHILLASTFLYLFLKSLDGKAVTYGVLAGLTLAIFAFFSFTFLVFSLFCFVFIALLLIYKKIDFQQLIVPTLAVIFTFLSIYGLVFLLSDFNLYASFNNAIHNENVQMKNSGGSSIVRYFIVSFGNLIAYLGILGPIFIGLYAERIYSGALKQNTSLALFIKSVLLSILILSFSGQFHLEVERIWIFLSPFALFGVLLYGPVSKLENNFIIRIALTLNIIMSIVSVIMFNDCT